MRRLLVPALVVCAIALVAAGCGSSNKNKSSSASSTSAAPATTNKSEEGGPETIVAKKTSLGTILMDEEGRAVYLFEKDKSTKSTCSGACAAAWPPVITSGAPKAEKGAKASDLGTTKRSDGKTQVTYGGHPIYYYSGDSKPGQLNGEGSKAFGAEWYALSPAGKKVENEGS
jgi:predicted lipoprotein with Yx(FWY)xxD motif